MIGILVLLIASTAFALAVHWWGWNWTGFNRYIGPALRPNQQYRSEKTLWDWLQLLAALAIPVVVGFGAAWFTAQHGKVSERENKDNQREAALQAYVDKMSELLLDKDNPLRESKPKDEVRSIARVRTLTVLRGLDAVRKGSMLKFLYESRLIDIDTGILLNRQLNSSSPSFCGECGKPLTRGLFRSDLEQEAGLQEAELLRATEAGLLLAGGICSECGKRVGAGSEVVATIVDLRGADLREADLREAKLYIAFLQETDLCGANLDGANLDGANLWEADLREAKLYAAFLEGADLRKAKLRGAFLLEAHLSGADLSGADLSEAYLSSADLSSADLIFAHLSSAKLSSADLSSADLIFAHLSSAKLSSAKLSSAKLRGADLSEAYLSEADLFKANLSGASVTKEQLEKAKSLKGATMPNRAKHP